MGKIHFSYYNRKNKAGFSGKHAVAGTKSVDCMPAQHTSVQRVSVQ